MGKIYDIPSRERRFWEMVPGILTWTILIVPLALSFVVPAGVAYFIVLFDLYWLFRSVRLSAALVMAYHELKKHLVVGWYERLKQLPDYDSIYHVVMIPLYNEGYDVIRGSIEAVAQSVYDLKKIILVLAVEARGGEQTLQEAERLEQEYENIFFRFIRVVHPDGLPGEIKGKGPNITYAAKVVKHQVLDPLSIPLDRVIVTSIDSDGKVHEQLLALLTIEYLKAPKARQALFQFVPMYHNNLWDAPAMMRVIATGCMFWLLIESTRPERLRTFACYALSFYALERADYWDKQSIIEDGVQYWRNLIAFDGDQQVIPIYLPVYQNAVLAKSYWKTYLGQYVQLRRWAWGASDLALVIPAFRRNPQIPFAEKFIQLVRLIDNHLSWSTAPLLLLVAGWFPLLNEQFHHEILAYNLPVVTSVILTLAMLGISISIIISILLLPQDPHRESYWVKFGHALEWLLLPLITIVFGSIPAIDSQTRLMLGKRLEFKVTPKTKGHE